MGLDSLAQSRRDFRRRDIGWMKAATNATEGIVIAQNSAIPIQEVRVSAYTIPTEQPESDGTIQWTATTMVLVEVLAGGKTGLG